MFNPSKDFSRNTIVKWFVPQKPGLRIKTKQNLEAIIALWWFQSKWNTCVKWDHLPKNTNLWDQQVKLRIDMFFKNSPTRLKPSQLLSKLLVNKNNEKLVPNHFVICFCSLKFPQSTLCLWASNNHQPAWTTEDCRRKGIFSMGLSTSEDLRGQSKMGVPPDMRKIPSKRCFHSPEDSEKKKNGAFRTFGRKKVDKILECHKGVRPELWLQPRWS